MIDAYNKYYLPIIQNKLGLLFDIAINYENMKLDEFIDIFLNSEIPHYFETVSPIYILGKSANELMALLLDKDPANYEMNEYKTPEYWTGYVLAYLQWYFNLKFKEINEIFPIKKIILNYFPYHEMDIMQFVDLFKSKYQKESKLKELRNLNNLSQNELAILSDVPVRTIKAYEQNQLDITKAQVDTLIKLTRALNVRIEDII